MLKSISTFLFLSFFFAYTVQAADLNKLKLDSLLNQIETNNKGMGCLAVLKDGKLIYTKAIGYSNIGSGGLQRATEKTKYRIGSITKMFTSVMIFQLIEEGKLNFDTPLDKFFPEIPNAKKITINHLLSHRSGIYNFTDDYEYLEWHTNPKSKTEMIEIIAKHQSDFEPGAKASYSNSNYVLLGYILENVCKKPYKEILQERITNKLELKDTYFGAEIKPTENEADSYSFMGDWKQEPATDMSIPHGAGSIVSTSSDLVKFIDGLFSYKLIAETNLGTMKTINEKYGMGIFEFPFDEKRSYGHTGGIDGFTSMLLYFPEDKLAVAYCSNGSVFSNNDIIIGVLSIVYNRPYEIPSFKAISLTSEDLSKFEGIYSSTQIPLKITVGQKNGSLVAQATGQSEFQLEAVAKNIFRFDPAGIEMEFHAEKKEFILKQGGGNILFTKE